MFNQLRTIIEEIDFKATEATNESPVFSSCNKHINTYSVCVLLNCCAVCFPSQILKRGCHVNDRDGLTDMTLLHYSCKAGAHGVGKRFI